MEMLTNVNMLGCVAAIVSAFQNGADVVQIVRDRRGKRRRMKESDWQRAVEEKVLHKSLVDGAKQCQAASTERCRRFGADFAQGDAEALSELKDVMISLQSEVIGALQIARAVENAALDLLVLQEAVITNKVNALRAMQNLCQRIMIAPPVQQYEIDRGFHSPVGATSPSSHCSSRTQSDASYASPKSQTIAGMSLPQAVSLPAPGIPERSPARTASRLQISHAFPRRSLTKSLKARSSTWLPYIKRLDNNATNEEQETIAAEEEQQMAGNERINRISLHDSAIGSSITWSRHKHSTSIISSHFHILEDRPASCATADSFEAPENFYKDRSTTRSTDCTSPQRSAITQPVTKPSSSNLIMTSAFPHITSPSPTRWECPEDILRANRALELVTTDLQPSLGRHQTLRTGSSSTSDSYPIQNIHPAFRNPYTGDAPAVLAPEPDTTWAALARPAKLNNYHNFCKGAWQARTRLEEGLSITLLPNSKGQVAPYWKCKHCAFQSKAMNSLKVIPDDVYFASCGVRYRWLFLAKSHVRSEIEHAKHEDYSYGCIFCAAQGSETVKYVGLESLMGHIVAKHKTSMMTPEVLEKTKCLVGGAPGKDEDWDMNLPESRQRKLSGKLGEFVVSAMTGLK